MLNFTTGFFAVVTSLAVRSSRDKSDESHATTEVSRATPPHKESALVIALRKVYIIFGRLYYQGVP